MPNFAPPNAPPATGSATQVVRDGAVHDLFQATCFAGLLGSAEHWAASELTMPQLKVLLLLAAHGAEPVSWLASRMRVSPPNVTGILDRLESRGWVARSVDPRDRRVVRVGIAPAGSALLWDLCAGGAGRLAEEAEALPPARTEALRLGLGDLVGARQQAR